ncbi:MAG: hypothetical protein AAFQ82_23520, partial [Myxococcota bacterium]
AKASTAMAEFFCARGKNVLLLIDSLSEVCCAKREIDLAVGEPLGAEGHPISTFLPRLLERGSSESEGGSLTGIYAVRERDGAVCPVSEVAQSLLETHVFLSPKIAELGRFPAIDLSRSVSRREGERNQ